MKLNKCPCYFVAFIILSVVTGFAGAPKTFPNNIPTADGSPSTSNFKNRRTDSTAFQNWGGTAIEDWNNASEAIVLTDMTKSTPALAFSEKLKKGCWKVMAYEMRNTPP
jgi:hypothetical protein